MGKSSSCEPSSSSRISNDFYEREIKSDQPNAIKIVMHFPNRSSEERSTTPIVFKIYDPSELCAYVHNKRNKIPIFGAGILVNQDFSKVERRKQKRLSRSNSSTSSSKESKYTSGRSKKRYRSRSRHESRSRHRSRSEPRNRSNPRSRSRPSSQSRRRSRSRPSSRSRRKSRSKSRSSSKQRHRSRPRSRSRRRSRTKSKSPSRHRGRSRYKSGSNARSRSKHRSQSKDGRNNENRYRSKSRTRYRSKSRRRSESKTRKRRSRTRSRSKHRNERISKSQSRERELRKRTRNRSSEYGEYDYKLHKYSKSTSDIKPLKPGEYRPDHPDKSLRYVQLVKNPEMNPRDKVKRNISTYKSDSTSSSNSRLHDPVTTETRIQNTFSNIGFFNKSTFNRCVPSAWLSGPMGRCPPLPMPLRPPQYNFVPRYSMLRPRLPMMRRPYPGLPPIRPRMVHNILRVARPRLSLTNDQQNEHENRIEISNESEEVDLETENNEQESTSEQTDAVGSSTDIKHLS